MFFVALIARLFTKEFRRKHGRTMAIVAAIVLVATISVIALCYAVTNEEAVVRGDGMATPAANAVPEVAPPNIEVNIGGDVNINFGQEAPPLPEVPPLPEEIAPPEVVDTITKKVMIENVLRSVFPNADHRGAEEQNFDVTTMVEIERFIQSLDLSGLNHNQFIVTLENEFANRPGWECVPIGEAKRSDGELYIITVVKEAGRLVVFEITPDGLTEVRVDANVTWVNMY
jgi:hypothetical protein